MADLLGYCKATYNFVSDQTKKSQGAQNLHPPPSLQVIAMHDLHCNDH
jgi:hypothetical protein